MYLLPEGLNLSQPVPRIQIVEHGQKMEQVKKGGATGESSE